MSTTPRRIYLDYNARAPLVPAAVDAMTSAMAVIGNPSSLHGEGRAARDLVERARQQVARMMGAATSDVVFTSGGSEAVGLGVLGLARAAERAERARVAMYTGMEHPAVLGALGTLVRSGWRLRRVAVDRQGEIDGEDLERALGEGAGLLAVSAVNHEIGVVTELGAVARAARANGTLVFVDAVQAAGKSALPPLLGWADAIAISAHKIGGPPGVGALWWSPKVSAEALPVIEAGHQERGRRGGTENVIGVAGFGAAAAAVDVARWASVAEPWAAFEAGVMAIEDVRINGEGARRQAGTSSVQFRGARGEAIVIALDLAGVAASTGAACTSGSVKPSPVLLAIGCGDDEALSSVRFSLGWGTSEEDVGDVLAVLPKIVERARRFR